MGRSVLLLATMTLALLLACGGAAQAIISGQPDRNPAHSYVGLAYNREFGCSGALISPRVFLTLGQCTRNFESNPYAKVRVTFERRTYFEPEISYVGVPHTHPQQDSGPNVGVVVLNEPVRTEDGYAKLPEADLVEELPHRTDLSVVGYDTRDFVGCYRFCGVDGPDGVAIRYKATQEYVGNRDFDRLHSLSGDGWIKTSQASAEEGVRAPASLLMGSPTSLRTTKGRSSLLTRIGPRGIAPGRPWPKGSTGRRCCSGKGRSSREHEPLGCSVIGAGA